MPTALWRMSAADLAALIRAGDVSAREVITAHLDRIAAVNAQVNAITVVLDEQALAAADAVDRALAAGEDVGPLGGVPMTVKENIDLAGSATTLGVTALEHLIPPQDAPHIAQLKRAGAIPIGRTNMPDMGLRYHTDNELRGPTLNPWDAARTPGGSSGGDAVALALGMTPLGMGNDYGGSLRVPATCNGVVGLRPTTGRVPRVPRWSPQGPIPPLLTGQWFAVQGPMARHVRDLRLALAHMSGRDPRDANWIPAPLHGPPLPTPVTVAVTGGAPGTTLDPHVAEALRTAANTLAEAGYAVEWIDPPQIDALAEVYQLLVAGAELRHFTLPLVRDMIGADARRFLELAVASAPDTSHTDYMRAISRRKGLADAWSVFMADYPLVLGPVMTVQPFPVGADIQDTDSIRALIATMQLTVAVNVLGLPAVAVPVGVAAGLPQGVQLIGDRFREDVCFDAAEALEARWGTLTPVDPQEM